MRFEQTTKEPEHRVMWNNGPTRRFSETRNSLAPMPYDIGGFVGNYVCQECDAPCQGVYLAKAGTERARQWICGDCRNAEISHNAKPKKAA